ncbi:hypothetical protein [Clostridium beijerinckii]|nr:hypothetical protein [Clostridium beijerinckii]NRZ27335.1 hypothetical protein [Clostridium beijerinckii]NYB96873.1 hypothetical protein [Clostridium beijerinckii]OOM22334.1 hypothetical protein CLBEI_33370 [Clostridium beijerinckii]SQB11724.1 Uncharacterised protein [Clostridium beijerinckii]
MESYFIFKSEDEFYTCFLFCSDPLNKRKPDIDYEDLINYL